MQWWEGRNQLDDVVLVVLVAAVVTVVDWEDVVVTAVAAMSLADVGSPVEGVASFALLSPLTVA